jgi:hypothetical protein
MSTNPRFSEWQLPNFSSFLPHLMITPAIWMALAPINPDLGLVVGLLFTAVTVALRFVIAKRILVDDANIKLGQATIPLKFVGKATSIAKEDQFFARGALAHPQAFLLLKSGLPGLVRIEMKDPNDPTPYLLVSTRKGEQLIQALSSKN